MIGFTLWEITGCLFIVFGIYTFYAKHAIGFWANEKMFKVKDIKTYNHKLGKLWILFGLIFNLLGIPLLAGQNSPLIMITLIGVVFEVIALILIYTSYIEDKYRS